MKSLSVFFPCYNDQGTIASMVVKTTVVLERLGIHDYEITVVDDGSVDDSVAILRSLQSCIPQLRIVEHGTNRGYGAALKTGFAVSKHDWVFYTDGDFQYDVSDLETLIAAAASGIDWVQGYKLARHDPLHRRIIGRLYHHFVARLFGLRVRDTDCDFRLIRKTLLDKVELKHDSGVICVEMMRKFQDAGGQVAEVPVNHYFRAYGKSQFFNFRRILRTALGLGSLWYEEVLKKALRRRRIFNKGR